MKRAQQQQRSNSNNHDPDNGSQQLFHSYDTNQPPAAMAMMRAMPALMNAPNTGTGHGGDDIATLLREIRDELRQNNQTLQELKSTAQVVPTTPDHINTGLV